MIPVKHIVASSVIAAAFYYFTKSFWPSVVCFASGFLIDSDHYLDYYFNTGRMFVSLREVYLYCVNLRYKKSYLIFHSHDLIILFWICIGIFDLNIYWIALALGLTQHLVLDQMFNRDLTMPFSYFLIYRIIKRFNTKLLFKEGVING